MDINITALNQTEIQPLAIRKLLAVAMQDDPLYRFLLPKPKTRQQRTEAIVGILLNAAPKSAIRIATDDDGVLLGAMVAFAPGTYPPTIGGVTKGASTAIGKLLFRSGSVTLARRGMPYFNALDPLHPNTPHYYLSLVGTTAEARGRGVGRALMDKLHLRADKQRVPVHLETNNEANVPYYQRFGYRVTHKIAPHPDGPPLWTMLRPGL